jgi:hypothetical protein
MGYFARAIGDHSTAIGIDAEADGFTSVAIGWATRVSTTNRGIAIGNAAKSYSRSYSFGDYTESR